MAVPLPFRMPVIEVLSVIAGVVVAVATVPARPLAETTDTLVTVPVPYASAGISAVVKALKVGAAAAPDEGPANIEFTACVVSVPVSVPLVVTGELVTAMIDGNDKPTEVTVPEPYGSAGMSAVVSARKVGTAATPLLGPAKMLLTA